jgi:hypothetical protein
MTSDGGHRSVDAIISIPQLRPAIIDAIERGLAG